MCTLCLGKFSKPPASLHLPQTLASGLCFTRLYVPPAPYKLVNLSGLP